MSGKPLAADELPLPLGIKQFPVSTTPTIIAFLLLMIGWLANEVALAWIHDRVPRNTPPLPDFFFSLLPELPEAIRVAEWIMLCLTLSVFLLLLLHKHRVHVARRVFFCASVCYLFRAFAISIIQMPVPSTKTFCAPAAASSGVSVVASRVAAMAWSAGIEEFRPRQLCGDLVVSGHTLSIITATLAFRHYAPRKLQMLSFLYSILAAIALFSILLARKHYSIDVLLGYLVASRVFSEYHCLALSFHEGQFEKSPLSSFLWLRLLPFMERDAPPCHLLSNHLEWPSPCFAPLKGRFSALCNKLRR